MLREELGSTKTYRASKRVEVEVPNLVKTAKLEVLVAMKEREGPTTPSIYARGLDDGERLISFPHLMVYTKEEDRIEDLKHNI